MVRRLALGALAAVVALAVLVGGAPAPAAGALAPWKMGVVAVKADSAFQEIAVRKGFYREQGLDAEIIYQPGDIPVFRAVLANPAHDTERTGGTSGSSRARAVLERDRHAALGMRVLGFGVVHGAFALSPEQFIRSLDASRDTLGRPGLKLLEVVERVRALTADAPYAVIGGLAQILWARESHTDDLDVALASPCLTEAYDAVRSGKAASWTLPKAPDADEVFEVYHLLCDGAAVDLIAFRDSEFNAEIITTARTVPELGGIRFIRPELLLVTHLLRPGPRAALSAVELVIARRGTGGLELEESRRWALRLGREARLDRVLSQADALDLI